MKFISEQNIGRVSFFFTVIVVSVIIFAVGVFFVVRKYDSASKELARVEHRLIEREKARLKSEVDSFLLRITSLREQFVASSKAVPGPETSENAENTENAENAEIDEIAEKPETKSDSAKQHWDSVVDDLKNAVDLKSAGYFIYHLHNLDGGDRFATMLFNPARPDLVGQELSTNFPDAKGYNFRKVFLQDIRDRGESFVMYHYNKDDGSNELGVPSESTIGRKLAYLKLNSEGNWIVAKSIRLDRIDEISASRQTVLMIENRNNLTILGLIFLGGLILALILAYLFSVGMQPLFDHYRAKEQEVLARTEALQKTLELQNRTDTLTSALNRGHFNQELGKEITRSERYRTPLSMILFDLDDFKSINDRLGCEAGDTVLVEIVDLIKDNIRQTDILARWGGEEFVILAPGIDLAHGRMFAEKLRCLVENNLFSIDQRLTCSFGIGFYELSENQHTFVQRVNDALSKAKAEGKNCCVAV